MNFANSSEAAEYLIRKYLLNPLDVLGFADVWTYAQENGFLMLPLWKLKHQFLALTQKDVQDWEKCIVAEITDPSLQNEELKYMAEIVSQKYPTPHNYLRRFSLCGNDEGSVLQAYKVAGCDFLYGQLIWDRVVSLPLLQNDTQSMTKMYLSRLQTPHKQLQQTYDDFSSWVSSKIPDQYTAQLREASRIVKSTERKMRYYEEFESSLAQNPADSSTWCNYIEQVAKYSSPDDSFHPVTQIFLRSLFSGACKVGNLEWTLVWVTYLKISENRPNSYRPLWCLEFFRTCPHDVQPYNMLLRGLDIDNEVDVISNLVKLSHCVVPEDYANWKELAMNILSKQFSAFREDAARKDKMLHDIEYFALLAAEHSDTYHEVVKLSVQFLESLGDEESLNLATKIVTETFENFASQARIWIYSLKFFNKRGRSKHVEKLLKLWPEDAVEIDDLGYFLCEILMFYRVYGDFSSYMKASDQAGEIRKQLLGKKDIADTTVEVEPKRQRTEKPKGEEHRNREQFRIKISSIPKWTTESDIFAFLDGYGNPMSVQIDNDQEYAIVELSSEAEVLSCLTRDHKTVHGAEVRVFRIFGNTVWITNYPLTFSPADVGKMIEGTGLKPLNVRFPVQNDNKQRRFCYADFGSSEDAQAVRNSLHEKQIGSFCVQAEISNPSLKRDRRKPPVSRQVYVHNLNFKETDESHLHAFFSKFGDVESVKMPLSAKNRDQGLQNNGFAFVTFITEAGANEAIKLGGADLDNRRIEISAVKSKQNAHKATHFDKDATVSVHNVNEIVTEDCLKAFLESKVGPVAKSQLLPSQKGALVQFTLVADAGKASILLDGSEYEGNIIHIGEMLDFSWTKESAKAKEVLPKDQSSSMKPSMVPPMLLRKRRM